MATAKCSPVSFQRNRVSAVTKRLRARPKRPSRNPTIKTDRRLSRDSSYVAEFVNTPIRLEDVAIELSDKEAMFDGLRLPVYGADDGAALRDILSRGGSRNSSAPPRAERWRLGTGWRKAAWLSRSAIR
jgi:hypothetical protein